MEHAVVKIDGSTDRKVSLADAVFGAEYKEPLVHQVVCAYLAGARSGTSAQKNRSAVSGGGAKPWRQKGTGRARSGTATSPIWRSGGVTFAAKPRNFDQKVNKKVKRLARKSALSIKAKQKSILIIEDFQMDSPKTSLYNDLLNALGLRDKKSLLVLGEPNNNVYLSSRNLGHSKVVTNSELNTYQITNASSLIFLESAVSEIESILNKA